MQPRLQRVQDGDDVCAAPQSAETDAPVPLTPVMRPLGYEAGRMALELDAASVEASVARLAGTRRSVLCCLLVLSLPYL